MSKTSDHKKKKYAAQFERTKLNKIRRIMKHLKRQPNDKQSEKVLGKK